MNKRIKIHLRIREHNDSIWDIEKPFLSYKSEKKKFSFDCFDSIICKENNIEIYKNHIKAEIEKFKEGQSLTIFAYGQTGSGKTHTMLGGIEDGLVQLSLDNVLPGKLQISFMEIFNEKIFDLCLKNEIKLFSSDNKCVLQGLHVENVSNKVQADNFIKKCIENRKTGATSFNNSSSRSHAVLQIKRNDAILTFIDLAGSEKSSCDGNRMKEAAFINKSLLSLGKLVNNMLNNKFFGFRDSKLTRILQDSISKKSSMIAFCMICPIKECLSESLGTINFAGRLSNLDVHLAKTEIDLTANKVDSLDFYKFQEVAKLKELEEITERVIKQQKINDEIIKQQKLRILGLEETVISLLKQIKDKKQEETFILEKQLFQIRISENIPRVEPENAYEYDESLLMSYLEDIK